MFPNTHPKPSCPHPLSPIPLSSARLPWRSPAGNEHAPRWIKNSPRKRTRMTRIGRIFTDFPIRVNQCHPYNPCSTAALIFVDVPKIRNAIYIRFVQTINLRLSAFICGSFSAEAPDINCFEFIKVLASPKSSPQSHHIPPTSSSKHSNSKTDKTGNNENI